MKYIKRGLKPSETVDTLIREKVQNILADIKQNRETAALEYSKKLDRWQGEVVLSEEKRTALIQQVSIRSSIYI